MFGACHFDLQRVIAIAGLLWTTGASPMDLLGLYQVAVDTNPALKIRILTAQRVRAEARVAESRLYPQISLLSSYSNNDYQAAAVGVSYQGQRTILMLRQPLVDVAALHRREGARLLMSQADKETEQMRGELFVQLADQYLLLLQANDELRQLQAEKEAAARKVERLQAMRARDMAKVNDLAEAIAWTQQLAVQEIDLMNRQAAARVHLQALAGIDPGVLPVMFREHFPPVPESERYWVDQALAAHAGLSARRHAVEAERQTVAAAHADHWPQLTAFYQRNQTNQDIDNAPRPRFSVDVVGVELRIPIYEGGRTSAAAVAAQHQLGIVLQELETASRQVESEVRLIWARALANRARIDATEAEVAALLQTVRSQERGHELGVVTVIEVLDARKRLSRARADQSRARYDYLRDLIALRVSAGNLTESEVMEFNRWFMPPPP